MGIADEMRKALEAEFSPTVLEIVDESERHRGHAGYQEGGESHWHITISAPAFENMNRVARHRAVHAALGPNIVGRIHALALKIS